ncbi:hypothetical protein MXB_4282, partial [Myxobolus squamalis]
SIREYPTSYNTMDYWFLNPDFGYLESLVRRLKSSILTRQDYDTINLGVKHNLMNGNHIENISSIPSPFSVSIISYGYMIDNICFVISGTIHHRPVSELLPRCHPLGMFEQLATIGIINSPSELYEYILVGTPLAKFFNCCVSREQFDDMNVESIRNLVYKVIFTYLVQNYLEEFFKLCKSIGGKTFEAMKPILQFQADRRCFSLTINSLGTDLNNESRWNLYPKCGLLYPFGLKKLTKAENFDDVKEAANFYMEYEPLFREPSLIYSGKTIEDRFFEYEVKVNCSVFQHQFNFGVFYAYIRLSEQQNRNIIWISECIAQQQKEQIREYIPIF